MTADKRLPAGMTRRILVVDDDARVRRALCALIRSAPGLSVVAEASSGPATLRADEELAPDVVLLDVLLPSLREGLEVLDHLVARGRAVVALSIREELRATALAAGAVAFVEKYAGPDTVLHVLRDVPLVH